jgi:hypothetical protein
MEKGKEGPKTSGRKAYPERWKNVVHKMETGGTDFVGDWGSKDVVAIRHGTTAYMNFSAGVI